MAPLDPRPQPLLRSCPYHTSSNVRSPGSSWVLPLPRSGPGNGLPVATSQVLPPVSSKVLPLPLLRANPPASSYGPTLFVLSCPAFCLLLGHAPPGPVPAPSRPHALPPVDYENNQHDEFDSRISEFYFCLCMVSFKHPLIMTPPCNERGRLSALHMHDQFPANPPAPPRPFPTSSPSPTISSPPPFLGPGMQLINRKFKRPPAATRWRTLCPLSTIVAAIALTHACAH